MVELWLEGMFENLHLLLHRPVRKDHAHKRAAILELFLVGLNESPKTCFLLTAGKLKTFHEIECLIVRYSLHYLS